MKRILPATLFLLSACTSDGQDAHPAVEVHTVVKTVEVMRPCPVAIPERPAKLASPLPTDGIALAAELALKLAQYSGPGAWADQMEARLRTCVKP